MTARSQLQVDAGRLKIAVTWLVGLLTLLLLVERFGPLLVGATVMPGLAIAATNSIAPAIYLFGLWSVRPALASIINGAIFGQAISEALRRVGLMLTAGSLFDLALKPTLLAQFGAGPGYLIALDFAGFALVGIGISLVLLGRLIVQARRIQSELDGMF